MNIFHHHHRTFFLPILILLTVGLVVFMFFSLTDSFKPAEISQQFITPVSSQEYTNSIKTIGKKFEVSFGTAENDIARLVLVENTLSELLALRVPSEFKEIHLELAVALSQLQADLRSQKDFSVSFKSFVELLATI
ncbi:hypothetical protein HY771_03355 [Candidatus Uhrbacteria bacterium]|nr:hypothetical protein [Candidatus Uhrbacteria bacterium]